MSFKKNKYIVVKKVLSKELVNFIYQYFLNKKTVAKIMFESKYISPFTEYFGTWDDEQTPNTYSHYSDIAMETLLEKLKPVLEKEPSGKKNMKGIKIDLKPGDMLIYLGCDYEHWREEFKGDNCGQVFLHYNNNKTKGSKINKFDKRPTLGLPAWFKNKKITVKNKND